MIKTSISLDPATRELLRKVGNGNASVGVRSLASEVAKYRNLLVRLLKVFFINSDTLNLYLSESDLREIIKIAEEGNITIEEVQKA